MAWRITQGKARLIRLLSQSAPWREFFVALHLSDRTSNTFSRRNPWTSRVVSFAALAISRYYGKALLGVVETKKCKEIPSRLKRSTQDRQSAVPLPPPVTTIDVLDDCR
jgi:hypothetical protein